MGKPMSPEKRIARYWALVDQRSPDECWPWLGKPGAQNYGRYTLNGSRETAHRVAYMLSVGPIPIGFHVDHQCHNRDVTCAGGSTCRHRLCQNPEHLDAVPIGVNVSRGGRSKRTHCPRNHPYNEANTYRTPKGRGCRTCHRDSEAARKSLLPKLPPKPHGNGGKTHCREGHPYAGDNVFVNSEGRRRCRECTRARAREAHHRRARRQLTA